MTKPLTPQTEGINKSDTMRKFVQVTHPDVSALVFVWIPTIDNDSLLYHMIKLPAQYSWQLEIETSYLIMFSHKLLSERKHFTDVHVFGMKK